MEVDINWLGVLLAAVSSMAVGSVWYMPKVLGNKWGKLAGVDFNSKDAKKGMGKLMTITFVLSLVTAYILAHVSFLSNSFFGHSFLQDALSTAFWMWLGFTAARIYTHDLFEKRPGTLTLITVGHELVTFLVMGLVIGLVGK